MMIPLNEVVYFDALTHDPDTGSIQDAVTAPTFSVFEEATDTPILEDQSMTKRTSLTGDYRGSFTASAANGFEAGKWYSVIVSATVAGSVTEESTSAKKCYVHFRLAPAENTAGVPLGDVMAQLTAAISDSVPADGSIPSLLQGMYMLVQFMLERTVSGTTCTVKKPNGSSTLFALTLNDATSPTSITRSS